MTQPVPHPAPHSHLSPANPRLQIAWDATSLGSLQFCPRYYQYTNLEGWSGATVDLEFGTFAATGFELYQKARLNGATKDAATLLVVRTLLTQTWANGSPRLGHYETQWSCTGVTPYHNAKGNRAVCPFHHKGSWFPEPAPMECGSCGSPTITKRNFVPESPAKNRQSLLRLLIWYIDEQPEDLNDGLRPYVFPDGTAAVELSFRIALPWNSPYGDQYLLTGHNDYLGQFGDEIWTVDNKTTTKSLTTKFWEGYSPHYQIDTYDLTAALAYPNLPIRGVMLDAAQVQVNGARFGRHPFYKTEAQREEHLQMIQYWIKQAEYFAEAGLYPMNKRNCWLCPFKNVCNKDPEQRERYLSDAFTKRELWNPLTPR